MADAPRRPRILIADDDSRIRRILRLILGKSGYSLIEAADGSSALEAARRERPDAILLDIGMPAPDGLAVCRQIKEDPRTRRIPVIMCTVRNSKQDLVEALMAGACDYVLKPFSKDAVLPKVERALRKRRVEG